jgi:hypothetical protein
MIVETGKQTEGGKQWQAATKRQVDKQVESYRLKQMQAGMQKQSRGRQEWRSRHAYMQAHGQQRRGQVGRQTGRQRWK